MQKQGDGHGYEVLRVKTQAIHSNVNVVVRELLPIISERQRALQKRDVAVRWADDPHLRETLRLARLRMTA